MSSRLSSFLTLNRATLITYPRRSQGQEYNSEVGFGFYAGNRSTKHLILTYEYLVVIASALSHALSPNYISGHYPAPYFA